ncbi:hypothetical protein DYBT9623_01197 [Dyadobacter sp. CECT 9623]|uniref:Polymerase beta nucleotidyltransferase domain-containing protein n=1 Tax=Dyadobacter linearis TaxID=2823330 RepID=A0ABN7R2S8_9BACT|nr:nucleotidyltransferase domain-containing protein [Dyadobacter sp. CECT 9623]CAG5068466.1 hypothetical protein DYBT9623_01197 [Dyadobacter sp. CECT 9623]
MDQGINRKIEDYIAAVAKKLPGLVSAYLFGSYSTGNDRTESDIDIALILNHLPDQERFNIQVQLMMLASQFDTRIEPHPISSQELNSAASSFAAEIKKSGIEYKVRA